jgi:hypothetical protein
LPAPDQLATVSRVSFPVAVLLDWGLIATRLADSEIPALRRAAARSFARTGEAGRRVSDADPPARTDPDAVPNSSRLPRPRLDRTVAIVLSSTSAATSQRTDTLKVLAPRASIADGNEIVQFGTRADGRAAVIGSAAVTELPECAPSPP